MASVLILVGFATGALALVAVVRPLPRLGMPTRKRAAAVLGCAFLVMVVGGALAPSHETKNEKPTMGQSAVPLRAKQPHKVTFPPDQAAFLEAVISSREAYREAANELARGGTRPRRRQAICHALKSLSVSGWMGRIKRLDSNNAGKGVLHVALADGISVSTWNNALSDMATNTLIDPATQLFAKLSTMKQGDRVVFSGRFFTSDDDCVAEQSLTLSGSMRRPEFVFKFENISLLR